LPLVRIGLAELAASAWETVGSARIFCFRRALRPWRRTHHPRTIAGGRIPSHHQFGGGRGQTISATALDLLFWRIAVLRIDLSDDRRTAESVLAIAPDEIRDALAELAKAKRLSIVMRNLNRLIDSPADQELGRRALRYLGFLDD
jgi:hypothetical protein